MQFHVVNSFSFPNISCRTCRQHLGWNFTTRQSNLRPVKFFGLSRHALMMKFLNVGDHSILKSLTNEDVVDGLKVAYFRLN